MTKARVSNCNARCQVRSLKEFKANNIWSEWVDDTNTDTPDARYVVYSYNTHWPLFIYDVRCDTWFENISKYGVTTSKHKTQCYPHTTPAISMHPLHVDDMIKVVKNGPTALITPIN